MRLLALVVLALVLALPPSLAAAPRQAPTIVVYHVAPDPRAGQPDADPDSILGVAPDPAFTDESLPATRVDDVVFADPAPQGSPESTSARFLELQRLVVLRESTGTLTMSADGSPEKLTVHLAGEAQRVELRAVVVEGIVARGILAAQELNLSSGAANATLSFAVPAGARADLVGVAIWARLVDATGTGARGEVVQSLLWHPGETARADLKQPLVEVRTASWCEPCRPNDEAVGLMASGSTGASGGGSTWRAPGVLTALGLAVGIAAAWGLTRR